MVGKGTTLRKQVQIVTLFIPSQSLHNLIKKCLEIAGMQFGVHSIAFPMIGCSKLGYDPKDVAECFKGAIRNTKTKVQV